MKKLSAAGDVTQDQVELFWSKVDITERWDCWEWMGSRKPKGYGNVRVNKKDFSAHRVARELSNFTIPHGYVVMHTCDNPPCCNPSHLMLGTRMANHCDMLIKGRQAFRKGKAVGENNNRSKLTVEKVKEIRALYLNKTLDQYQLAEKFGVSQPAIGSVVRRDTWKHVA